MTAYVHVNLRVLDATLQASLAPRFQAALERAGGRIVHFGPVVDHLEGAVIPLPLAGIFAFETLEAARAFYLSADYAPIKVDRLRAQEARMFIVNCT